MTTVLLTTIHCRPQHIRIPTNLSLPEANQLIGQPPTFEDDVKSQNSIKVTVEEVEGMLRANPKLPRLTRGEILELLENLTKSETVNKVYAQPSRLNKTNIDAKFRDPKAIMMVLPFTPDADSENNVEDLYMKPPITKIVDQHQLRNQETNNGNSSKYGDPPVPFNLVRKVRPTKKYKGNPQMKTELASTTTTSTTAKASATPKYHSGERKPQYHRRRTTSTTTNPSVSSSTLAGRYTITTTQKYYNHRYEDEPYPESPTSSRSTLSPNHAFKMRKPSIFLPKDINEELSFKEDVDSPAVVKKDVPVSFASLKDTDLTVDDIKEEFETMPYFAEIPEHLKGVLSELNLESALKAVPKKFTPKYETSNKEDDELNNLLTKLKLSATITTTSNPPLDVSDVVQNLSPDMKDMLINYGLIPSSNPPKPMSETQTHESYIQEKAEVNPESYVGFKRFPEDDNSREAMQELFAKFGLEKSTREQKSLGIKDQGSVVDMVPYEYQNILKDIGYGEKNGDLESAPSQISSVKYVSNPVDEVYATNEKIEKLKQLLSVLGQLEQLNRTLTDEDLKLIDTESFRHLIASVNQSNLNDLSKAFDEQNALDSVDSDLIIKNEVKREENSSNSEKTSEPVNKPETKETSGNENSTTFITETTTTEKSTTPQKESTTLKSTETPSMKDLEDSFGGLQNGENDSLESTAAPPPPTPDTGFYYLLDWNTFLDIDDQKGRRVNLRFQPKVGNPMKFLHVSVP